MRSRKARWNRDHRSEFIGRVPALPAVSTPKGRACQGARASLLPGRPEVAAGDSFVYAAHSLLNTAASSDTHLEVTTMSIFRRTALGAICLALAGTLGMAQAPSGPPKPGPEHQKLARFVGTWNGKAEMKPGPFGPGGPMTWTETCDWFEGGFSVVCKSDGKGPMGAIKGLGIIG